MMFRRAVAAMLVALVAASAACTGSGSGSSSATVTPPAAPTSQPAAGGAPSLQRQDGLTTVQIAQKLQPSIVRVQTEIASVDAFGRAVPGIGVGTGVIIDGDGHIVTNNHVVTGESGTAPANSIRVTLFDQTSLPATIVGRDQATDLAVIKIDHPGLTPATWADPASLEVGQDVVAIGFALDLEGAPSVTAGVLSAKNRTISEPPYTIPEALQTDAGINPGNSGGALVNARGEVIGINTAIIQNAQNIGFAISVALANPIVERLIQDGSISRSFMGIATVDVNQQIVNNFHLPIDHGLFIATVADGSPADSAGLQENDVIESIDGQEIDNNGQLLALLAQKQPGDTVTVTYYRSGDKHDTRLTLGERPAQ